MTTDPLLPPMPATDPGQAIHADVSQKKSAKQYRLLKVMDMTPNDLFAIKMHTKVDLLRPPTTVHGDCANLWYVSRKDPEPLVFEDLLKLPLHKLNDLILGDDEDDEDENDDAPREASENDPKASANSPESSSPSPESGEPHPQP